MHGSILIYGGSEQQRLDKCLEFVNGVLLPKTKSKKALTAETLKLTADVKLLEPGESKKSIGIETVRECMTFLREKPYEYVAKVVIIPEAEKLTGEAQNALLNMLEEPPSHAQLIVLAKTTGSLLATVVSRCKKYELASASRYESTANSLEKLIVTPRGERLALAEKLAKEEREDILAQFDNWLTEAHTLLNKTPTPALAISIERLHELKHDLDTTNVNSRLALEVFLLNLSI